MSPIDPEEVRRRLGDAHDFRDRPIHAAAREWLRMQEHIVLDCGSNSCRFAATKGGMRTNGGCRCFERAGFGPSAVQAAYQMLPEIARLRAAMQEQGAPVDDEFPEPDPVAPGMQYDNAMRLALAVRDAYTAALDCSEDGAEPTLDLSGIVDRHLREQQAAPTVQEKSGIRDVIDRRDREELIAHLATLAPDVQAQCRFENGRDECLTHAGGLFVGFRHGTRPICTHGIDSDVQAQIDAAVAKERDEDSARVMAASLREEQVEGRTALVLFADKIRARSGLERIEPRRPK
ncbi:hypothetical protein K2Z84_05160 [Candidatus Binatia bacterium]|nr:hypothetical protein [Candidatus Binatia bacterium]